MYIVEVRGLPAGCKVKDMKSASFQTILLLENGLVYKVDHQMQGSPVE